MKLVKSLLCAALLAAPLAISTPSYADEAALAQARATLNEALPGKLMHNPYDVKWGASGNDKRTKVVSAPGIPGEQAFQVRVKKKQSKPWDINIAIQLDRGVKKGDEVVMHFWARAAKPAKNSDTGDIAVMVQMNKDPYRAIVTGDIKPTAEWNIYTIKGVAVDDYSDSSLQASFQLGRASQTLEFGQFYISNLGQ